MRTPRPFRPGRERRTRLRSSAARWSPDELPPSQPTASQPVTLTRPRRSTKLVPMLPQALVSAARAFDLAADHGQLIPPGLLAEVEELLDGLEQGRNEPGEAKEGDDLSGHQLAELRSVEWPRRKGAGLIEDPFQHRLLP